MWPKMRLPQVSGLPFASFATLDAGPTVTQAPGHEFLLESTCSIAGHFGSCKPGDSPAIFRTEGLHKVCPVRQIEFFNLGSSGITSLEQDHYAVLGLTPTADQAAVRSAYRSLMRRYHPDADQSEEAASQSRSINIAYATLGDPAKRETYDSSIGIKTALKFDPVEPRTPHKPWPARVGAAAAIVVALIAAGMIAFAVFPRGNSNRDISVSRPIPALAVKAPAAPKRPTKAPPELSISEQPVETPPVRPAETKAVVPEKPRTSTKKSKTGSIVDASVAKSEMAPSNCSGIAQRADRMVCNDANLASLDRQTSLLYRQSWAAANERKRVALLGTRQIFNDRRDECETQNCLTSAYVGRLKEISDIMAGRQSQ